MEEFIYVNVGSTTSQSVYVNMDRRTNRGFKAGYGGKWDRVDINPIDKRMKDMGLAMDPKIKEAANFRASPEANAEKGNPEVMLLPGGIEGYGYNSMGVDILDDTRTKKEDNTAKIIGFLDKLNQVKLEHANSLPAKPGSRPGWTQKQQMKRDQIPVFFGKSLAW